MSDFLPEGKLDNQEIRKALLEYKYHSGFKPSKKLIDDIIEQFWFHDFYNSFVSDPIFLSYLKKNLGKDKPKSFNRYNFYQFIFDQIVKGKQREGLQLIATAFEQAQTDSFKQTDYEKLLKKLKVPKSLFTATWLQENHLAKLEEKEGKKNLVLQHHTLSEFLTAEYIFTQKDLLRSFQDMAVLDQEGIVAIKPSWYGVLRFLLESDKGEETLDWLLSFLNDHPDDLKDKIAELLTFINFDVSEETKKQIFKIIYESYSSRPFWLPTWARGSISKFVDKEIYKQLKGDLKEWSNETETFIRRGNVVSIVDGLLKEKNPLVTGREKDFWKRTLIKFANDPNENGVLQRNSLDALVHFKDSSIIPLVSKKNFNETKDSLVRDTFLQFCANSDPDSHESINFFIEGIKRGSDIYARHGLFKVTKPESIKYFLSRTVEDKSFWELFLHNENIFSAKRKRGDHILLENIEKAVNNSLIRLLKRIIKLLFEDIKFYHEARSSFIRKIGFIIQNHDPNYVVEIIERIKSSGDVEKINKLIVDYEDFLAILLNEKNIEEFFGSIKNFPSTRLRPSATVYIARRENGEVGQKVYEKAVKLKLVPPIPKYVSKSFEEQGRERRNKIYKSFLQQLQPAPGKYKPSVFEYFLQNRKEIEKQWKNKDEKRLLKLVLEEGLKKIDPKQFKVTITDKSAKSFQWTSIASYYGDLLAVANLIAPKEIKKFRQNIIDFIPYAFTEDITRILELIPEIKDRELSFVNGVMLNKNDHRRYLIPDSYIYIVGEFIKRGNNLKSAKKVILTFIEDNEIDDRIKRNAIEALGLFLNPSDQKSKNLLQEIFNKEQDTDLGETANSRLITSYKDEAAIDWRFKKVKQPIEFEGFQKDTHWIGPVEEELTSLVFAQPLINLGDKKYLPKFLDLLRYSIDLATDDTEGRFKNYIYYIWKIVMSFVEGLKTEGSFKPLRLLEDYIDFDKEIDKGKNTNWLKRELRDIRNTYVDTIGKSSAIKIRRLQNVSTEEINKPADSTISEVGKVAYSKDSKEIKLRERFADFMKNPLRIFISHASSGDDPPGVKKFVKDLAKKVKNDFGSANVFFDEYENLNSTKVEIDNAILKSRYCIVIYTKRYQERFRQHSTITGEANSFEGLRNQYRKDLFVVVLYDTDRELLETKGIYFLRGMRYIKAKKVPVTNYLSHVNDISREISTRINGLEDKYKKEVAGF